MDFELWSGRELPYLEKKNGQKKGRYVTPGTPGAAQRSPSTLSERALILQAAWKGIGRLTGATTHSGEKRYTTGLRTVRHWAPAAGITRRPVFLAGEATEAALRYLTEKAPSAEDPAEVVINGDMMRAAASLMRDKPHYDPWPPTTTAAPTNDPNNDHHDPKSDENDLKHGSDEPAAPTQLNDATGPDRTPKGGATADNDKPRADNGSQARARPNGARTGGGNSDGSNNGPSNNDSKKMRAGGRQRTGAPAKAAPKTAATPSAPVGAKRKRTEAAKPEETKTAKKALEGLSRCGGLTPEERVRRALANPRPGLHVPYLEGGKVHCRTCEKSYQKNGTKKSLEWPARDAPG